MDQLFQYMWKFLSKCSRCSIFGHIGKACPCKLVEAVAQVWKLKLANADERVGQEEMVFPRRR